MFARKICTGIAAVAVSVSALALTGTAAYATTNPQPSDTSGTPVAANLIGVGSDTSQDVVKAVSDGYNATNPAAKVFTYAACATTTTCGTITLPGGDIARPNGSGAGKGTLYGNTPSGGATGTGTNGDPDIDFARSSSALSTNEQNAGLVAFPFAVDTLIMVTSGNVASHAPSSLTIQQILGIYNGSITNWSQLGGASGTIKPLIPQSGSGTRNFFIAQLTAANGGSAPTLASNVTEVQEHDPGPIQNDPDAVAPFSLAKSIPAGTALRGESGFSADRAIYNVVRSSDASSAAVLAAFGSTGYFCSDAAKSAIVQSGFRQLLRPEAGGACGTPNATTNPTSNLAAGSVSTATSVAVSSASAASAKIVATVTSSPAPQGTVSFYEGGTLLKSGVRLTSSQASVVQPTSSGSHTYTAVFVPIEHTAYVGSQGTGTGTVQKATSSISEKFKKAKAGKTIKGTVTVSLAGSAAKASGPVVIKAGKKTIGKGTLKNGVASVKIKAGKLKKAKIKNGKLKVTAVWAGDANGAASTDKFTIKVVKAKSTPKTHHAA